MPSQFTASLNVEALSLKDSPSGGLGDPQAKVLSNHGQCGHTPEIQLVPGLPSEVLSGWSP